MATITHKQGDTLEWIVTLNEGGNPVDITSYTITAQIRSNDTLIASLTVIKTNAVNGEFRMSATAVQTDSWSAGAHSCDIEFVDDLSNVFSTETFGVTILEDITHT